MTRRPRFAGPTLVALCLIALAVPGGHVWDLAALVILVFTTVELILRWRRP